MEESLRFIHFCENKMIPVYLSNDKQISYVYFYEETLNKKSGKAIIFSLFHELFRKLFFYFFQQKTYSISFRISGLLRHLILEQCILVHLTSHREQRGKYLRQDGLSLLLLPLQVQLLNR